MGVCECVATQYWVGMHTDEWVCVSVLLSTGWGGVLLSAASDVASLHLKPCTHTHTHTESKLRQVVNYRDGR